MYNELVKRLREEAKWRDNFPKDSNLMREAADAIEELQKAVNFHKFNSEFWEDKYNSLADEKWIPVTERLPENGYYVLAYEDDDIMMASYEGGNWVLRDLYEIIDDLKPTHWMPLPEPPKEET